MKTMNTKKRILLATLLTSGLTLAISQAVIAEPTKSVPPPAQNTPAKMIPPPGFERHAELIKVRDTFLADTIAQRKALAEKSAEMQAIMKNNAPDPAKASAVAGQLFDIHEQLRAKAKTLGFPLPMLMMGTMMDFTHPCMLPPQDSPEDFHHHRHPGKRPYQGPGQKMGMGPGPGMVQGPQQGPGMGPDQGPQPPAEGPQPK